MIANACFIVLWTKSIPEEASTGALADLSLWTALVCASLMSLGLYVFAVAMNDVMDVRRDRAFNPDRPLASGRLSVEAAFATVVGALLLAIAGATPLGSVSVLLTLALAAAITVWNTLARNIPAATLVLLATIVTAYLLAININIRFLWPIWVISTHLICAAAVAHVYAHKVPRFSPRAAVFVVLACVGASAAFATISYLREGAVWPAWVSPWSALAVILIAFAFIEFIRRRALASADRVRGAERIWRYASLWPGFYAVAWLALNGQSRAALGMGALITACFAAMITLRESYAALQSPVEFRR